ncbi:MAG TPA: hypothetical protein VHV51_03845 [Polyangiaceae bacterium]|jgi:hypothetical protein|nr:hypothetical protein [Polyangiaceae bacterium]
MKIALKPIWPSLLASSFALPSLAHAEGAVAARTAEPSGDSHPAVEVRSTTDWAATEEVDRPAVNHATMHLRLVLPGDFGTWAYAPSSFSRDSVPVTGGEIGIGSNLSLVLEGAADPFDHRFSGMASGLRFHLLPPESTLKLSVAGGFTQDLSGARGLWSQLALAEQFGRWHFAGALRASQVYGALGGEHLLGGSAGAAFDLLPVRLGLEYAFERGRAQRSAILPWIEVPTKNQHVTFRAGPVLQINGANAFPARVSVAGNF